MILRQYELTHEGQTLVCWLEDGRIKVGDAVTLKDPPGKEDALWSVKHSYSTIDSNVLVDQHKAGKVFDSIQPKTKR